MMREWADVSAINDALKVLCRERGVQRDRMAVLEIATLLLRLVKEGVTDGEQLTTAARSHMADVFREPVLGALDDAEIT